MQEARLFSVYLFEISEQYHIRIRREIRGKKEDFYGALVQLHDYHNRKLLL